MFRDEFVVSEKRVFGERWGLVFSRENVWDQINRSTRRSRSTDNPLDRLQLRWLGNISIRSFTGWDFRSVFGLLKTDIKHCPWLGKNLNCLFFLAVTFSQKQFNCFRPGTQKTRERAPESSPRENYANQLAMSRNDGSIV